MTRVLLITTGLPKLLTEIVSHALASHANVQLVAATASAGGLVRDFRHSGASVLVGAESELACAEVAAVLEDFPRSRVFTLTPDARMAWLCELRPERVALGELSPGLLAQAILVRRPDRKAVGRG